MSETTTTPTMIGTAGVVKGNLQLSQGIRRPISTGVGGQFTDIPIFDISPMINVAATAEVKTRLVSEVYDACTRVGFFIATDHGVGWNIVEKAFNGSKEFFDLPMQKKMEFSQDKSTSYQGYEPPYYTNVDRLKKGGCFLTYAFFPDLKESITTAHNSYEDSHGMGADMPELLRRHNLWPNPVYCHTFRPALDAHRRTLLNLARQISSVIAVAIGEKADIFDKNLAHPIGGIRSLYYPPTRCRREGGKQDWALIRTFNVSHLALCLVPELTILISDHIDCPMASRYSSTPSNERCG